MRGWRQQGKGLGDSNKAVRDIFTILFLKAWAPQVNSHIVT